MAVGFPMPFDLPYSVAEECDNFDQFFVARGIPAKAADEAATREVSMNCRRFVSVMALPALCVRQQLNDFQHLHHHPSHFTIGEHNFRPLTRLLIYACFGAFVYGEHLEGQIVARGTLNRYLLCKHDCLDRFTQAQLQRNQIHTEHQHHNSGDNRDTTRPNLQYATATQHHHDECRRSDQIAQSDYRYE